MSKSKRTLWTYLDTPRSSATNTTLVLTHARKGTDVSDGGENLSKIELALTIAKQESVRVSTKGIRGGALDYPAVRDITDRQYETELNSGTVYTAFDRLARQYECFHVTDGEQGPNSKNK